jgi:hypothetical protein
MLLDVNILAECLCGLPDPGQRTEDVKVPLMLGEFAEISYLRLRPVKNCRIGDASAKYSGEYSYAVEIADDVL